jgi:hypothetical protein
VNIDQAAKLIGDADTLVIAAGAGMGVDSGLPDFRSNTGFWKAYPGLADARIGFTEVASLSMRTTGPAAWPPLSSFEFRPRPIYVIAARVGFLPIQILSLRASGLDSI